MNRKRVQMLRNVIAGIPANRILLDTYINGDETPCGSVACIAGWAEMYFREKNKIFVHEEFFGLPPDTGLFSRRQSFETGTHKQIALKRLDALLKG